MPFLNDPYHSKAYNLLEELEANYTDLCNLTGILPIVDHIFIFLSFFSIIFYFEFNSSNPWL